MSILENIRCHNDLLKLDAQQRTQLCREIRDFLVSHVSKTGGHLASNLGVVELTVAIETVFNTEKDRLVFDVGHQSYVHKLLTGRQADFDHLRQFGGISGYPKPQESITDAFVAGHASSSVSIALGMARARTLQNEDYQVVALLGDGAATGGMVYEGLNDAAVSKEPMVIILNDNEMSIARNVGALSRHLTDLRASRHWKEAKTVVRSGLNRIPLVGKPIANCIEWVKDAVKSIFVDEQKEGFFTLSENGVTVALDTTLTPALIAEGHVRELISKLQTMRKEAGFEVTDRITVTAQADGEMADVITNAADELCAAVLSDALTLLFPNDEVPADAYAKEWDINGETVTLSVKRV